MLEAEKLGYRIHVMVHAWKEMGWGCWWMCRWVGVTLLCTCKGSSCLKGEADDCDVIRWCHCHSAYVNEGVVFKEAHMSPGASSLIVASSGSLDSFLSFLGSHRPSVSATSVPLEEWDYNHKVFFIFLTVCVQGYPEHLELVSFSCLWVSQVTSHPASIWPGTRKARTTGPSEWSSTCGINMTLVSPLNSSSIPRESHIYDLAIT